MIVKEVWVLTPTTCHLCSYHWIAAYLAPQVDDEVRLLGQIQCPECGNMTNTGDEYHIQDDKPEGRNA